MSVGQQDRLTCRLQNLTDDQPDRLAPPAASVIVNLLRNCKSYQFHDTSESSSFKNSWDVSEGTRLRSHGGNLAAVLYRLERYEYLDERRALNEQ